MKSEAFAAAIESIPEATLKRKRRAGVETCLIVALRLADKYRPDRGYVDETNGQLVEYSFVADVRPALQTLNAAGIWVAEDGKRGRARRGTRRSIGPVLQRHHPATLGGSEPAESDETLGGSEPAQTDDDTRRVSDPHSAGSNRTLGGFERDTRRVQAQPSPSISTNLSPTPTTQQHRSEPIVPDAILLPGAGVGIDTINERRDRLVALAVDRQVARTNNVRNPTGLRRAILKRLNELWESWSADVIDHAPDELLVKALGDEKSDPRSWTTMEILGQVSRIDQSLFARKPSRGRTDNNGQFHPENCGCDECNEARAAG